MNMFLIEKLNNLTHSVYVNSLACQLYSIFETCPIENYCEINPFLICEPTALHEIKLRVM